MSKQSWKPGALLAPVPAAMVTCGTVENPKVLTIAWTGIINTIPAMTYISVRPQRNSYETIKSTGEFVINLTTKALCRAADYCGVKSGADTDKFRDMNLTAEPASQISAPLLGESPLSLECRVVEVKELGSHHMFLAEIVAVDVDEALLDRNGKLDLGKANMIAYAHGDYYALGERLGDFGFSVRKKKTPAKKRPPRGASDKTRKQKTV